MPDSFQLEMVVAAEPQRVFSAWLDAKEHAAFTAGGETVVEPWTGGRFISWDGYIHGILLGVDAQERRIVQTWRTMEFPPESRDSRVTVEFAETRGGTRVVVRHTDLPPGQLKKYEKGWLEHYLKPLSRYFAKGGRAAAAKAPPPTARALATTWGRREERKPRRATPVRKTAAASARKTRAAAPAHKARKPARRPAVARKKPAAKRRPSRGRR